MATATATTIGKMTVHEFEALELYLDQHELWWGELRQQPEGGMQHSGFGLGIGAELRAFVRPRGLGLVTGSDGPYILSREQRVIFVPDAAFVAAGRLPPDATIRKAFDGPPDLAVEVVSPSDRIRRVEEKARTWLRFGTRLVWVLHPAKRTVSIWTPDGASRTIGEADELDGGDVLPGFRILVADLFS